MSDSATGQSEILLSQGIHLSDVINTLRGEIQDSAKLLFEASYLGTAGSDCVGLRVL
jgi:hypothetical protein